MGKDNNENDKQPDVSIELVARTRLEKLYLLREAYELGRVGVKFPPEMLNACYEDLVKDIINYEAILNESGKITKFNDEFLKIQEEVEEKLESMSNLYGEDYVADMTVDGYLGIYNKDNKVVRVYTSIDDYKINIDEDYKVNFKRDKYFENMKQLDLKDKSKNVD